MSTVTETILSAKKTKGVSFEEMARAAGCHEVWLTSVIYGQNSMSEEQAGKLGAFLDLDAETVSTLSEYPLKNGLGQTVPVDPLIYRFHEIMQVYGMAMKAVIHEKFGDGIMSAIDFEIDVQKKEDPKGDRVVVVYNGKFLPYRKW